MKTIADIQKELREVLPEGIDLTILAIKNCLPSGTDKHNDLILIEARYREVNHQLLQGILSPEDAQIEFNKIRKDLLDFINSMVESQLATCDEGTQETKTDVYNGEVFYRIPDQMVLNEETKCIVRVAFDRTILLEGIEIQYDDVVKDIRISDVMGVELLDPDPTNSFAIRTFSDPVQFVDKDLSTEWLFYVKPLKGGKHPLILKISVIEIKEGIERKRTVVLEEHVEIFTEPVPEKGGAETFTKAGYVLNMATTQQPDVQYADRGPVPPPPPQVPSGGAPPAPSPSAPTVQRKGGGLRKAVSVLSALLVLIVASFALMQVLTPSMNKRSEELATNNVERLRDIVKNRPGTKMAEAAQHKIDSLDEAFWSDVFVAADTVQLAANADTNMLKYYIEQFPDGKHVTEAFLMLEEARKPLVKDVIFSWQLTDSVLNVNLDGGTPPYFFSFIQADTTYRQVSRDSGGAFFIPRREIRPGSYELILQDAEGRSVSDSIFMEEIVTKPIAEEEKKPNKGVTRKRKKPAPAKVPPTPEKPAQNPPSNPSRPPAQPEKPTPAGPERPVPVRSAARKPIFQGCDKRSPSKAVKCTEQRIRNFVSERLKYPPEALRKGIEGTVKVEFVVEKDGSITDVKYLNEIGGGCGPEAVRLVQKMPRFQPGTNTRGEPIRVLYQLPIKFQVR